MDSEAFRKHGREMVDLIADYWDSLKSSADFADECQHSASTVTAADNNAQQPSNTNELKRRALSHVKPGYIWNMIPKEAPREAESWAAIFADVEPVVLSANTNWHHPNFHAYYPTACSYAAIMGDMLSGGLASIGFTWNSSPAMTELEMAMTDWLARAIGLPECFLNADPGPGAGILQSTASDATFVALLSARARAVDRIKSALEKVAQDDASANAPISGGHWMQNSFNRAIDRLSIKNVLPQKLFSAKILNFAKSNGSKVDTVCDESEVANDSSIKIEVKEEYCKGDENGIFRNHDASIFSKFVAYCSDQAHSSVDKGVMLSGVRLRKLKSAKAKDGNFSVAANVLEEAIRQDRAVGLTPFILIATVGTTNTCAVERVAELGAICAREGIWLHVDAAYAGSFLLCEEFRYLCEGIEFVDSFNFNAHKAMMINFDCSPMWFKNATESIEYFKVDPLYLKHQHQKEASDYRHLQIALGRRFRALKIWFVLRAIGIPHIQAYLRKHIKLAAQFATLITNSEKFQLFVPEHLGLVCFRLKCSGNEANEKLTAAINADGRIHLVPANVHGYFFLRFSLCNENTTEKHVQYAFDVICEIADNL